MLRVRPDLWIGEAAFERLDRDHWVSIVKVEDAEESRRDIFFMPRGFNPRNNAHVRRAAIELRDHYLEEED